MKKMNTLLLVAGCLSASFVTGCNSQNSANGNPVNNNQKNGAQPKKPSTPSNPGTPGASSVCFVKSCTPVIAKTKLLDPRGEFNYLDPARFPSSSQREFYRRPIAFIDLSALGPNTRLTADFYMKDFADTSKGRYALLSPSMVEKIQNIRDRLGAGLHVNSGYRSPAYNRRIDRSATWSRHMYGDGVDLGGKPMKSIRAACVANHVTFFLLYRDGHVHCDWRSTPLEPALFPPSPALEQNAELVQNALSLSGETQILSNETSEGIHLAVKLPEFELEGTPSYEWIITSPSGQETKSDSENLLITAAGEKGTYSVKVIVGDFIESDTTVDIH